MARTLATGSLTAGRYGLYRWDVGGPGGATPHFHRTFAESFYILSGTVALYDGAAWADGTAGDFHYVPEGGIHAFGNADPDTPASVLILFAPARHGSATSTRSPRSSPQAASSAKRSGPSSLPRTTSTWSDRHGRPCRLDDSSTRATGS